MKSLSTHMNSQDIKITIEKHQLMQKIEYAN